ncbi:cell wall hydrolase [Novosphingobium sp. RD2P27]|uniref:Cell wall hydrolase n=1 Tax=Novosphingobium kalidii TaxID=3230299 RepID=A0ABV2CXT3_9SPHN
MLALACLTIGLAAFATWLLAFYSTEDGFALEPEMFVMPNTGELPGSPGAEEQGAQPTPAPLTGSVAAQSNDAVPFHPVGAAARAFRFTGASEDRSRARACLAATMLYEAGDSGVDQLAVAQVVLNRVRHPAFPGSICGVVTQGSERRTGCQFTFTCDGALARPWSASARARALVRADLMLDGLVFAQVGHATHYHTQEVYPWWSPQLEKIAHVGSHLFFRWPGDWGSGKAAVGKRQAPEPAAALFTQFAAEPPSYSQADIAADTPKIEVQLAALEDGGRESEQVRRRTRESEAQLRGAGAIPPSRRLTPLSADPQGSRALVVGSSALGGSRLLRMFADEAVFYLELPPGSAQAAGQRAADLLCGGRTRCAVYGWREAGSAPAGPRLDDAARKALAFSYLKPASEEKRPASSAAAAL